MAEPIRVLIADDHAVVREGLQSLMRSEAGLEVVGAAADGQEAIAQAQSLQPDVVLLDLQMPQKSGLEAIEEIRESSPGARILILTSFGDEENVYRAVRAGAVGYLLKDASPEELIQAVRDVHEGQFVLKSEIALRVIREIERPPPLPPTEEPLTEREVVILRYVARGLSNNQIARELTISERTVRTHISNILEKLHLANRTQAALFALKRGLASLDDS